ncbi:CASP-like protein 1D1 [Mangifera indica]|uniref:CASP-like protein 1D1 n=1 Tax=Mangifera indica TaxID=29780 RepID=UPI001CFB0F40|nr:CASP-like protein 1D1 [Mangifera indica]
MEYSDDKLATPPESETPSMASSRVNCFVGDVALRVSLFAATLVGVVFMVTSKQTELVAVPGAPVGVKIPLTAKFNQEPAFVYLVIALLIACLYSIIKIVAMFLKVFKPTFSKKLLLHFALLDLLIFGVVVSATGAAGAVGYVGWKGDGHVGWSKVCPIYDKFCGHTAKSIAMSLLASVILFLLSMLSIFSLYKRARDQLIQAN